MSEQPYSVRTTLVGGIQDVAALLPLLGTDQCEKHVGSALDGGYIYAAAAPLSIFGSLGIVKAGITVLISSISIPKLSVSFTFNPHPKISMTFRGRRWFGARTLDNAGFKPVGTVSPLIAMDGSRYKAETRLMEILEEKHIEDPERLSVEWKSTDWNVMLVVWTMIAAGCGVIPYIPFISPPYRSSALHSPWIFPLLRAVGSCLAAACCQLLTQSRVISLMKNRIIFMIMDRTPGVEDLKSKAKESDKADQGIHHSQNDFRHGWDESLPSEECLWYLERCLPRTQGEPDDILTKLRDLQDKHIRTSSFNYVLVLVPWTLLFLSLPATIAGYIGCFMLVSGSSGNDPLIWLGLEAALSIIRILLWAWNPRFDERTDITLRLELAEHQPFVTTEKSIELLKKKPGKNTVVLVPERRFLEWITSYTGPLEQFQSSENLALYFTLTGNRNQERHLYLTVLDINKRIAVTLHNENEGLVYIDSVVTCNKIASEMEATLQTAIGKDHPWRMNHASLFDALSRYYFSIIRALNRSHSRSTTPDDILETLMHGFRSRRLGNEPRRATALLPQKWNLFPKDTESNSDQSSASVVLTKLTVHDKLYLQRGYEHHLKTDLLENWSSWIVEGIDFMRKDVRNDCHHVLTDETSEKAKWELIELDRLVASEWRWREWSLLQSSFALEGILRRRMEKCAGQIMDERKNERLKGWMGSEFEVERRKRLEKEREQAKERVEKEMKISAERAEREGWEWRESKEVWEEGQTFIDEQWRGVIEGREGVLWEERTDWQGVRSSFTHWRNQGKNERHAMDAAVERIRNDPDDDDAYTYPRPSSFAFGKFVALQYDQSHLARACAASVYDLRDCDKDNFYQVIQKSTTRSVINVDPDLIIPENDHLLYLSFKGHSQQSPFIQRNRERWWDQQTTNSFTFYFSPQFVDKNSEYVCSNMGAIAHIFIFLLTQTRLRVGFLHCQIGQVSVSIQGKSDKSSRLYYCIYPVAITERLQLLFFELDQLEPGRHDLEVVVTQHPQGCYGLRDIFVEFLGDLIDVDEG